MKNKQLRNRIILYAVIALITVGIVVLILVLSSPKKSTAQATMQVAFGSLSSNLSSVGTVNSTTVSQNIPLAHFLDEETLDYFAGLGDADEITPEEFLEADRDGIAFFYSVAYINEEFIDGKEVGTDEENAVVMRVLPLRLDWSAAETDLGVSLPDYETKLEYLKTDLLKLSGSKIAVAKLSTLLGGYLVEDAENPIEIGTGDLSQAVLEKITYADKLDYTVSGISLEEGDRILPAENLMSLGVKEWYTAFTLSEYDITYIHSRMQNDERVYASVGINALNGRKVLAEIVGVGSPSNSSGVSYFRVTARLIFPQVTEVASEEEGGSPIAKGDYSYYDNFLTDTTVRYLGVDLSDNLSDDELLSGYSVTVTAQKTVITDTLIVATKCIYYDDAKNPYVIRVGTDNKESRVYIKITLSTGTDAAVTAAEGYSLSRGDVLRYTSDTSLLQSLF